MPVGFDVSSSSSTATNPQSRTDVTGSTSSSSQAPAAKSADIHHFAKHLPTNDLPDKFPYRRLVLLHWSIVHRINGLGITGIECHNRILTPEQVRGFTW
jgi:hypothetical protein